MNDLRNEIESTIELIKENGLTGNFAKNLLEGYVRGKTMNIPRFKVEYQICPHCHGKKIIGYMSEFELLKIIICGNCQIGVRQIIVLEEFQV